jgi:DNA-binding winged helix-turn-helix (wHTH) protein
MRLRFGECLFDTGARQLTRAGEAQALSPKAFQLLELLLESRPRALSKQQLHDRLWPGTYVSHTSLARVVNEVRQAIGDGARQGDLVRTVHGFGYAFSGAAADLDGSAPPAASASGCGLLWSGRLVDLPEGESLIGRGPDCVVRIPSPKVSRHHARVVVTAGQARVEDLGSKNGTFVKGQRTEGPTTLAHGDDIVVGPAILVYCAPGVSDSTETGTD